MARCASYDAHLATAPQHIPTQHDMLPQHLVCKYELNCEYCNITLAMNKAPWWWCDKIETCRSVLKCFKIVLCEIICAFVGWWIEGIKLFIGIGINCIEMVLCLGFGSIDPSNLHIYSTNSGTSKDLTIFIQF